MIRFIVLLNFIFGAAQYQTTVRCPDMACVQELQDSGHRSPALARLRAFDADTYQPIAPGRHFIFPPFIDETYI